MALEELGTTIIKLGQVLSTRPDLVPAEYVAQFGRLQDAAPPVPFAAIAARVREELGAPPEAVFAEFDVAPLASASIGQVHRARLHSGQEVVVKVQRPGVEDLVERDLEILLDLAPRVARHTPLGEHYDVVGLVQEFAHTLRDELDYTREGRNADRFRALFAGDPALYVPAVCWEHTTRRVLTMERIQGIKINDTAALDAAGVDRRVVAKRAVSIMLREVFVHGFFHADPHPGNFFVLDGARIGLMDFGMVGHLDEPTREGLLRVAIAIARHDPVRLADALLAMGMAGARVRREALTRDLGHLLHRYTDRPIKEIAARPFVHEVLGVARRHRLQMPTGLVHLAKVIGMSEGLGVQLDPEFKLFEFAAPYFQEFWRQSRAPQAMARRIAGDAICRRRRPHITTAAAPRATALRSRCTPRRKGAPRRRGSGGWGTKSPLRRSPASRCPFGAPATSWDPPW